MPKRKSAAVFLPLYYDADGKETLQSYRLADIEVEKEVEENGEKVKKMVPQKSLTINDRVKDQSGMFIDKAMNRKARRTRAGQARRHAKRFRPVEIPATVVPAEGFAATEGVSNDTNSGSEG